MQFLLFLLAFSLVKCEETIFVVEFIRHGARSHFENRSIFEDVGQGELTQKGEAQMLQIGLQRRQEYVFKKRLLSERYNQREIIAIATFKNRCIMSGELFLRGIYPLQDIENIAERTYDGYTIENTLIEKVINDTLTDQKTCLRAPILGIPFQNDHFMHTSNCLNLHTYLNQDLFDHQGLYELLEVKFPNGMINSISKELSHTYNRSITSLRHFFTTIDAHIAELYHMDHPHTSFYQQVECFILAHNFHGPNPLPEQIFLSRLLSPLIELFSNLQMKQMSSLKYLLIVLHDTQLSNMLRHLGYFDPNQTSTYKVRFASSLRIEIVKMDESLHLRFIFDNEEFKPQKFCSEGRIMCELSEFIQRLKESIITDADKIKEFCNGSVEQFDFEIKYKS
ncbi:hypothetical protein FGO68_gene13688 [Halteria grandinella]|uniref:Uncharacterized protein n=1 Tax=Halteria grandinella TaxID=5974 RepID=A0A8J8NPD4_HALGN|nr:hypothetical protein FGO68_gene13688 [Halteria grandinella]